MKKMLLIGDSISLYYAPILAKELEEVAQLFTKEGVREAMTDLDRPTGGNGGDSKMVLDYVREREAAGTLDVDLFAFNCGLHDIKREVPEENINISPEQYEENLNEIFKIAEKHGIKTIYINSTAVPDEKHNARVDRLGFKRYNKDLVKCNEVAEKVAKEHNIPVIDLYNFTENLPGEKYVDHVHFDMETREAQAKFLAKYFLEVL